MPQPAAMQRLADFSDKLGRIERLRLRLIDGQPITATDVLLLIDRARDATASGMRHAKARLRQALWRELPQVTKIVVAQRVSTITDADRIIVLDDGRMVGIGTHEELLETNQTYREIVQSQLGAEVTR